MSIELSWSQGSTHTAGEHKEGRRAERVRGAVAATHWVASVLLPYDLLSVNKELKSIGLHFVFSIFNCLTRQPALSLSLSVSLSHSLSLCFSLCISLSLHSIFTAHWFHFCALQFRNKISPRCKLKLQCNWLIHAYITSPVTHCPLPLYQDMANTHSGQSAVGSFWPVSIKVSVFFYFPQHI